MQKTIKDMAAYLQNLLPQSIPEVYTIDAMFHSISDEESIRKGVLAFKGFLRRLYDRLIEEGGSFDKPKKIAHAFADGTNISTSYPFLCNIAVMLANIGSSGVLNESRDAILLESVQSLTAENNISNMKIPDSRKIECLQFLVDCGIRIDGVDLSVKKPDLAALTALIISYPENPAMLTGLTAMATAQRDLTSSAIQDILLRCDYRALANKEPDIDSIFIDLIKPLPADVQEFMRKLHLNYMKHGYKCTFGTNRFYMRFTYFYRSKELWRFNISLNNGYDIGIKALNTHKYAETIEKFPKWLQEKIAKGYGCGKKMGTTDSCDGGCRGFRVPLNDSFMEVSDVIETWIIKEVSL